MKKALIIMLGAVLLLLALLIILPLVFKGKIVDFVKETANKEVNAHIDFSNDIGLSLLTNFPDFTLEVKDISVAGKEVFEGDTLVSMSGFKATLDLMSVIKGEQIRIREITLISPRIKAIVLKDGKANWDIAKPSADSGQQDASDSTTAKFNVALKQLTIENAHIVYDDRQGNIYSELNGFNHSLTGDFTEALFVMNTLSECKALTVSYGGIRYLNQVEMKMKADIEADMNKMLFTFKDNEASLNNLAFAFKGWYQMQGDDMNMDITYAALKSEFKNFLSLIPSIYAKDFSSLESSGKMGFDGFVKGTYNEKQMPAFAFNLLVENGMFRYPALPVPVKDVQMKLAVTNPDGDLNHTKIDLSRLHLELSGDAFDARMTAVNVMKDPEIDAFLKGRINLGNITKVVPMEEGTTLTGIIDMNLEAKGHVSTLEKGAYEAFNANGEMNLTSFVYAAKDLPQSVNISSASLSFNPKTVRLNSFDAKIGRSDMQMTGELSNFFAYAFSKGTLKGVLNFSSTLIDANEFLTTGDQPAAAPEATDTASLMAPEIPGNIEFTLNSKIGKLIYTNLEITQFNGQIRLADQRLNFNKVALNTLGSSMTMDGYYETTNPKKPTTSVLFGIKNLDIQKAFVTFNTVKKLAPIAEKTTGSFSTLFKLNTALDQHLNPVYDDLFAEGKLDIPQASISGVKLFDKAAETLKYDKLRNPALHNVHIQFKVEKGRIYTQPFDVAVASQKLTLSGSTGLDQTIDYTGKTAIPRSALGGANSAIDGMLAQANAKAGTGVKLSDVITVNLTIGGTFTDPKVGTNLSDVAKNEASSVKSQLAAEAEKKKKELEMQARAEGDRLKKEAEAKIKAETDKLKKEAEAKANAEKEKARKKAEEEAKKQLKGLFGK